MDEKKEYIERGALLEKSRWVTEYDEGGWGIDYRAVSEEEINNAPAADVVEVVRCKDCHYYEEVEYYPDGTKNICRTFKRQMHSNDFCSYGERK